MNLSKEKIAGSSVLVNLILAISKIIVGIISNSAAILSDGLHSGVDVFSSGISYLGIKKSKKPADKKHPYGHYKFEVLTGLIITIILFGTGIEIIYNAYEKAINPGIINIGYIAIGVMIFSAIVNEAMARLKIKCGKKENSLSLLSDGYHSRIDAYSSIAILFGLILTFFWIYIDAVLAFLIGIYIIKEAIPLGKEAVDSLLDVSAGKEIEEKIKSIAKKENIKVSDLKTQKKGSIITANLEINLPNKLSVEEATKISNILKEKLIKNIKNLAYVTIQIKSHKVTNSFYKPFGFGRGFGWQRKGKFKEEIKEAKGSGPGGFCICPMCGYKVKHKIGVPCSSLKCPKCRSKMARE